MEIRLSKKQQKQTQDIRVLRRVFGKAGDEIAACLDILKAVDNLQELLNLPDVFNRRCHELHKNLKDTFSMDLVHPYRLLFRPADPIPRRNDNGVNYIQVRIVTIRDLHTNTHE